MNRFVKNILSSLLAAMMISFYTTINAQIINEQVNSSVEYDPISATLDSLVNLMYIQRLHQSETAGSNNFKPFEVPTYSADIYKRRIEKIQSPIPLCYNSQVMEYISMYGMKKRANGKGDGTFRIILSTLRTNTRPAGFTP